jgi:hypothetical protein
MTTLNELYANKLDEIAESMPGDVNLHWIRGAAHNLREQEPELCNAKGECGIYRCHLPLHCKACGTCLPHCAGMSTMWRSLRYYLRFWWSTKNQQGGWIYDGPISSVRAWLHRRSFANATDADDPVI